jgi:hypothetical protein
LKEIFKNEKVNNARYIKSALMLPFLNNVKINEVMMPIKPTIAKYLEYSRNILIYAKAMLCW